jgi:predicted cobalt transporter CbtA
VLSVLAVLAFRLPAYLSTPELRASYDVTTRRYVLFAAMVIAGGLAIRNIVFDRSRRLSATAFGWLVVAQLLGGPAVPVGHLTERDSA